MRILLHCGFHKTGTTSIQASLLASRQALLEAGILYPDPLAVVPSHHLLIALDADPARLWPQQTRLIAQAPSPTAFWERLEADIDRHAPHTVILSTEYISSSLGAEGLQALAVRLRRISPDIACSLYVREPVGWFASLVQQSVKTRGKAGVPYDCLHIRLNIEALEAAFGHPPSCRAFDRAQLEGGDAVRDFVTHILERPDLLPALRAVRDNESISPEACAILQKFRRIALARHEGLSKYDSKMLMEAVSEAERARGLSNRIRLLPHIREAVISHAQDYLWLRDVHGVSFSNLDYEAIARAEPSGDAAPDDIEALIEIDHALAETLLHTVLGRLIAEKLKNERQSRSKPAPRPTIVRRLAGRLF